MDAAITISPAALLAGELLLNPWELSSCKERAVHLLLVSSHRQFWTHQQVQTHLKKSSFIFKVSRLHHPQLLPPNHSEACCGFFGAESGGFLSYLQQTQPLQGATGPHPANICREHPTPTPTSISIRS